MATVFTLTGPSTSGKTTLERLLRNSGFTAIVSTTTREARPGEVDGVHYHFVTKQVFLAQIGNGEFVEYSRFGEHYYGIRVRDYREAVAQGAPVVVVMEPIGANRLKRYGAAQGDRVVRFFLSVPLPVLVWRLFRRHQHGVRFDLKAFRRRAKLLFTVERRWQAMEWDMVLECREPPAQLTSRVAAVAGPNRVPPGTVTGGGGA